MASSPHDASFEEVDDPQHSHNAVHPITQPSPHKSPPPDVSVPIKDLLSPAQFEILSVVLLKYCKQRKKIPEEWIQEYQCGDHTNIVDALAHECFSFDEFHVDAFWQNALVKGTVDGTILYSLLDAMLPKISRADPSLIVDLLQNTYDEWEKNLKKRLRDKNDLDKLYMPSLPGNATSSSVISSGIDTLHSNQVPRPTFYEQFPKLKQIHDVLIKQPSGIPEAFTKLSLQHRLACLPFVIQLCCAEDTICEQKIRDTVFASKYLFGPGHVTSLKELCEELVGCEALPLPLLLCFDDIIGRDAQFPLINPEMVVPSYDHDCMQNFYESLPSNKKYLLRVFSRYLISCKVLLDDNFKARNNPVIDGQKTCSFFYKAYIKLCSQTKNNQSQNKAGSGDDPDDDPFYYDDDDEGDESDDDDADHDADRIPIPNTNKDIDTMSVEEIGRDFAIWVIRALQESNEGWQSVLSGVLYDIGSNIKSLYGVRGELISTGKKLSHANKNPVRILICHSLWDTR